MIAEKIKQLREQSGFTQTELAKRLNITRSSVNAWEMGISVPSTQYVVELSDIFKVSTDYILRGDAHKTINIDQLSPEQSEILFRLIQYFEKEHKAT